MNHYAEVSCFSIVILSVILLSPILLSVILLYDILLNVILLRDILLNVILLNDIMLSVVAPFLPDGAVESPDDEWQTRRLAGRSFPDEISANLR
jgi:hypothetical protein